MVGVSIRSWWRQYSLEIILFSGVLLRVVVFYFLDPTNSDDHLAVIKHIYSRHNLPISRTYNHAFHPPLYHLLAALFYAAGSLKMVQSLSLTTSIVNVYYLYRIVKIEGLFSSAPAQIICLSLGCFLPSYVIFSLYISNDSLTFMLGTIFAYRLIGALRKPSAKSLYYLSFIVGLGLLTKGIFLAFIPVLVLLIIYVAVVKMEYRWDKLLRVLVVSAIILVVVGSYKYLENAVSEHRLIVHNLDFDPDWSQWQKPTITGYRTFLDINILQLLANPTWSAKVHRSIPLMFYSQFWYLYYPFDNNFKGCFTNLKYIGSALYVIGVIPTLLFLAGYLGSLFRAPVVWSGRKTEDRNVILFFSALLCSFNLTLVMLAGLKYDVWSCYQSRLFYAAFPGMLVLLDEGIRRCFRDKIPKTIVLVFGVLFVLLLSYFASEIVLILVNDHGGAALRALADRL